MRLALGTVSFAAIPCSGSPRQTKWGLWPAGRTLSNQAQGRQRNLVPELSSEELMTLRILFCPSEMARLKPRSDISSAILCVSSQASTAGMKTRCRRVWLLALWTNETSHSISSLFFYCSTNSKFDKWNFTCLLPDIKSCRATLAVMFDTAQKR